MSDEVLGMASIKRVAFGGVTAFAIYIAGTSVTASSQLLIARLLGAETYGVYAYVMAWTTVLAYFSALGFDTALLRFVAAYQTKGAWSLARGVIQYAERRALVIGILVVLVGTLVIFSQPRRLSPELRNTFLVGFVLVPVLALLWIRCSIVRAFGGVIMSVLPDKVVRDGLLLTRLCASRDRQTCYQNCCPSKLHQDKLLQENRLYPTKSISRGLHGGMWQVFKVLDAWGGCIVVVDFWACCAVQ